MAPAAPEAQGTVLACDIDDTLLAVNSRSPAERSESDAALQELCSVIGQQRASGDGALYFGSATGRTLASHKEREGESAAFAAAASIMDFQITSVGAAPYLLTSGEHVPLPGWPDTPNWDRDGVLAALFAHAELTLQPSVAQGPHKVSFNVHTDTDTGHADYVNVIASRLAKHAISAQILFSGGVFLDILPVGVNKGTALLRTVGALAVSSGRLAKGRPLIIAAGDSMNDCDMLQAADRAILPANSHHSLRQWAQNAIAPDKLYVAEAKFAAGILEGYRYFTRN
ncbi:MAG TPA: HAD family hydrolase, partial [Candidatus Saccharimonadales bacterium]|nr:HAD family hydrolase [Candidatus Saccharimonadales bacterium]